MKAEKAVETATRRITFVKYDGVRVEIHWEEDDEVGNVKTFNVSMPEKPKEEFIDAFDSLRPHVVTLIEADDEYTDGINIRKVKFSRANGRLVAEIHAIKKLQLNKKPLNLNVPAFSEGTDGDSAEGAYSVECHEALQELIAQSQAYLDGNHEPAPPKQGSLFDDDENDEE